MGRRVPASTRSMFSEHHALRRRVHPLAASSPRRSSPARPSRVRISVSALLLPLYDVIRVAEDMAVLDLASAGRVDLVIGAGYRPEEYELHDRVFAGRFRALEDGVATLRAAWSGRAFEHRGRMLR